MRSEKLLEQWYLEARQQLVSIGFPFIDVPIKLNGRLETTLGYSDYNKEININKEHFLYGSEKFIKNTIMHECTHQLLDSEGHGSKWQDIVNYINKNLEIEIKQYASNEEYDYRLLSPKYTQFKCVSCGKVLDPIKISGKKDVKYWLKNGWHKKCRNNIGKGKLTLV